MCMGISWGIAGEITLRFPDFSPNLAMQPSVPSASQVFLGIALHGISPRGGAESGHEKSLMNGGLSGKIHLSMDV